MSYPPVRYAPEHGTAAARIVSASRPPDLVTGATQVGYLATTETTAGDFGLYRYVMTGAPTGPGPHFHRTISESFYVLSGRVRLFDGSRWTDAEAGDFLHVPVGGVHAFRNESGERAEMLLLFTPGAAREAYFEELAAHEASGRSMTEQERRDLLARHDQYDA